jgi:hypothetical protein
MEEQLAEYFWLSTKIAGTLHNLPCIAITPAELLDEKLLTDDGLGRPHDGFYNGAHLEAAVLARMSGRRPASVDPGNVGWHLWRRGWAVFATNHRQVALRA